MLQCKHQKHQHFQAHKTGFSPLHAQLTKGPLHHLKPSTQRCRYHRDCYCRCHLLHSLHRQPCLAAQQLAEIADGDNRGIALLLPLVPAVLWVLYNILQPALNQINRMRSSKGVIIGLGLSGLAASGFFHPPEASAGEIANLAEAAADNRGQLLLFVVAPAILWVLYNILQPALNQINRMRSD
ncbi:UNVERIFIED_CONTAM: Photosystem II core complex proteins psbY, chloroplastic [Sesamum radiatum]|uniref:Photosystem II core complex proteins psbY, chloroplastic n=1 Tax=Sesamum radiatum TaxID=300843 RepID=A0AAW2TVF5_SESRA